MKLGCDGNSPCKTCEDKGLNCSYLRLEAKKVARPDSKRCLSRFNPNNGLLILSIVMAKISDDGIPLQDRCSIKVLLNSGSASFMESFRFPDRYDRKTIYESNLTSTDEKDENDGSTLEFDIGRPEDYEMLLDPSDTNPINWFNFENEDLFGFLDNPFVVPSGTADDFATGFSFASERPTIPSILNFALPPVTNQEAHSAQSAAIIQALEAKVSSLSLGSQEQANVLEILNYLFTPSKMDGFVKLYFELFHPHCPIIHQPSFDINTTPISLLLTVVLAGAMYSTSETDVNATKVILDLAELYIYTLPDFTEETEVRNMLSLSFGLISKEKAGVSHLTLHNLQAAYILVIVQFWSGNTAARKRCMETRYGAVVNVRCLSAIVTFNSGFTKFLIGCEKTRSHESKTRHA